MPIVYPSDALEGLKLLWDRNPTLAALVPGGVHHDRVTQTLDGEPVPQPYATVEITEGPPEFNSSSTYVQPFTLQLMVWSERGNVDAANILRAIDLTFVRADAPTDFLVPGADRTIDLRPVAPGDFKVDEATHEALDQVIGRRAWELVVQVTR